MKKAFAIIAGFSIMFLTQTGFSETITKLSVPQDITQFYSDLNFAACFSTPSERSKLRFIDNLEQEKGLSQRLKTVGKRLNSIESRIKNTDPGMVTNTDIGKVPYIGSADSVTAEFVEIIATVKEGDTIFIRVRVWPFSQADNAVFIASYDESQEKAPAPGIQQLERLPRGPLGTSSQGTPRTEIHKWSIVNGRWMRNEANIVLIQY